jgi:hypothetical protein
MPYSNEQIEEWAADAWNSYYAGTPNPPWAQLTGAAKEKQLQIAQDVAARGASAGSELEAAYAAAFAAWSAPAVREPRAGKKIVESAPVKPTAPITHPATAHPAEKSTTPKK